jgi:FkbM family methyltransferase
MRLLFESPIRRVTKLLSIVTTPSLLSKLLRFRVVAGIDHAEVLSQLAGCKTIIDIGANRGQFSLAARHLHPTACIEAFEPLPAPALTYSAVFAGDGKVRLHGVAIGPDRKQATIHLSGRDDSSSLLPITATQDTLFAGTAETGVAMIDVGPLRDFIDEARITQPAVLKIDVQGFELETLKGCESLLHHFSWVYVECSFMELYEGQAFADEVIAWLRDRGFRLLGVYNMLHDPKGQAIQGDFLFMR